MRFQLPKSNFKATKTPSKEKNLEFRTSFVARNTVKSQNLEKLNQEPINWVHPNTIIHIEHSFSNIILGQNIVVETSITTTQNMIFYLT